MSRGRYEEAEEVLQKIAKSNKQQIPEGLVEGVAREEKLSDVKKESAKVWRLFSHRTLMFRTLIIAFNRYVNKDTENSSDIRKGKSSFVKTESW